MTKTRKYRVAEHEFRVEMGAETWLWERMTEAYAPFEIGRKDAECSEAVQGGADVLFGVRVQDVTGVGIVADEARMSGMTQVYSNKGTAEPGFIELTVYKGTEGHCFEFTQPMSEDVNGRLFMDSGFGTAELYLSGTDSEKWLTFNTGLNFCFLLSTACHQTVLAHSSCVEYQGKAYLFLGKSGTGKSTHSRMWLNALDGVILMNDDHPVIRISPDGTAVAYGSPWSGKTRCYKNIQAPIGGIIRIVRAPYNKARRLTPIESYASLMTSFSGMTWEKELADGRDRTIQSIISSVPCWVMECLPDEDAARVCCKAVTEA